MGTTDVCPGLSAWRTMWHSGPCQQFQNHQSGSSSVLPMCPTDKLHRNVVSDEPLPQAPRQTVRCCASSPHGHTHDTYSSYIRSRTPATLKRIAPTKSVEQRRGTCSSAHTARSQAERSRAAEEGMPTSLWRWVHPARFRVGRSPWTGRRGRQHLAQVSVAARRRRRAHIARWRHNWLRRVVGFAVM